MKYNWHQLSAPFHWWTHRLNSILLIPAVLFLVYYLATAAANINTWTEFFNTITLVSPYFILATNLILFWHISQGVETVIEDYVHGETLQYFCVILLRVASIKLACDVHAYILALL